MSYVVAIQRSSAPITLEEFRAAILSDAELRELEDTQDSSEVLEAELVPSSGGRPEVFSLYEGEISVTNPSARALRKMQSLAAGLGASVSGEEGEDLTEVEVPTEVSGGCGSFVVTLAALLGLVLLYWLAR